MTYEQPDIGWWDSSTRERLTTARGPSLHSGLGLDKIEWPRNILINGLSSLFLD